MIALNYLTVSRQLLHEVDMYRDIFLLCKPEKGEKVCPALLSSLQPAVLLFRSGAQVMERKASMLALRSKRGEATCKVPGKSCRHRQ